MNRRIFAGIVLFALLCAMLTGCGGREKVDLNGAASLADLRGATLGAQTGTFHLQALEQVEGVTKKDYADFTDLLNALRSGAIDGYVAEEPTALEVYAYPWDSLIPAVQSGAVDAIMAGMSPTAERALQVDFTDCYYNSNLVIIIRK